MRVALKLAKDRDIRDAHMIIAIDPRVPSLRETPAGEGFLAPFVARNAPAFELRDRELELDSGSQDELNEVRRRVQQIRGGD